MVRRIVGAVVVVALFAWGVWWQFGSDPLPGLEPPEPVVSVGSPAAPGAVAAPAEERGAARAESVPTARSDSWLLAVQAVDAFGDPVASASMELWRALGDTAPFQVGIADARGEWRVPVRDEVVFVRAWADGLGTSVRLCVDRSGASTTPIALMLLRTVPVRGLVLAGDGGPLRGVVVELAERWQGGEITRPNLTAESLRTDGDGRFMFDCVVGTTVELHAAGRDGAADASLVVTQPCEVLLACPGAFRVDGTITDGAGRPIAGIATASAFVNPFSGAAALWVGEEAMGQPANTFSLALAAPGRHVVYAKVPGHRCMQVEVLLSLQERSRIVTCVAQPTVDTRGVVVDASGSPVEGVSVKATPDDAAWGEVVEVAAGGAFHLPLVAATGWTLSVPGRPGNPLRCAAGDTAVRLVVPAPAVRPQAVGVDVFTVDGTPPRYAVLTTLRGQGTKRDVDTVRQRGELPRLSVDPPDSSGRWLLLAQDPFTRHAGHVWIESNDRPIRLVLEPLVPFEVTVRRAGKPVRGVVVRVEPYGEAEKARVDAAGVARFAGLAHGPAVVRVLHGNAELATREVVLRSRDFGFLTIDLP